MQLVNNSYHMLHASEPVVSAASVVQTPDDNTPAKSLSLRIWLPIGLLVAVVLSSVIAGAPNRPRDELDWLSRLANNGDAGAQLQLGLAYRDGRYGLTPDAKTGLFWLKQSAAGGNAYAEDAIGNAYANGQGISQNTQLAEQWYRKAIKDGDQNARVRLADMLIRTGQTREGNQLLM